MKRRTYISFILILGIAVGGLIAWNRISYGNTLVIQQTPQDKSIKTNKDSAVVRKIIINGHVLILDDKITLKGITNLLGKSSLISPSAADSGTWSTCYQSVYSGHLYTLKFLSNVIGGPDHRLLGFELKNGSPSKKEKSKCSRLILQNPIATDNGLYIGMKRTKFLRIMGTPTRINGNTYLYEKITPKIDEKNHENYDATTTLFAVIKGETVVELRAWYVELT